MKQADIMEARVIENKKLVESGKLSIDERPVSTNSPVAKTLITLAAN